MFLGFDSHLMSVLMIWCGDTASTLTRLGDIHWSLLSTSISFFLMDVYSRENFLFSFLTPCINCFPDCYTHYFTGLADSQVYTTGKS